MQETIQATSGAFRFAVAAMLLMAATFSVHAQATSQDTSGAGQKTAPEIAPGLQGIGLTPVQKRIIYDNTSGERPQPAASNESLTVGAVIPDSFMLNEIPIHVKDEVGVLRDFKFATLQGGQSVLIVDPANRKIVEIVTKADAGK